MNKKFIVVEHNVHSFDRYLDAVINEQEFHSWGKNERFAVKIDKVFLDTLFDWFQLFKTDEIRLVKD